MEWRTLRLILLGIAYVLFVMAAYSALTMPVSAQPRYCLPVDRVPELAKELGETLLAVGQAGDQTMRLYVNAETRGWTLFSIRPDGLACVITSGTDFDFAKPAPAGRAS